MDPLIYLDHAATTPTDPAVVEAMLPYLTSEFGNPSALYAHGKRSYEKLAAARERVAKRLGARPGEIIFNSGGTEALNAGLRGIALAQRQAGIGAHIVTTSVEHHAVLFTCNQLEEFGFEVTYLSVDGEGCVDPTSVASAVRDDTVLVSVMLANNEVGTIQPIQQIATVLRTKGEALGRRIPLFTDAVAAAGHLPIGVDDLDVDALAISAHKFGGPKGGGVLYLRRGIPFLPQVTGGGQERQRRAGTENVAAIVGTAVALDRATDRLEASRAHVSALTARLNEALLMIPGSRLNGPAEGRLPNNVNISFAGIDGEALLLALDAEGIAVSTGSACASATWEPSHVLMAMGVPSDFASGALRLSLAESNTAAEVDRAIAAITSAVATLRGEAQPGATAAGG